MTVGYNVAEGTIKVDISEWTTGYTKLETEKTALYWAQIVPNTSQLSKCTDAKGSGSMGLWGL